jgi:hypothetical protein
MGEIGFNLTFYQSRVYAEQMECVVRSEDGIVLISPGGEVSNGVLDWSVIQVLVKKLRTLRKEGAAEIEFYRLLDKIYSLSVDKEFSVTEDVCKHQ